MKVPAQSQDVYTEYICMFNTGNQTLGKNRRAQQQVILETCNTGYRIFANQLCRYFFQRKQFNLQGQDSNSFGWSFLLFEMGRQGHKHPGESSPQTIYFKAGSETFSAKGCSIYSSIKCTDFLIKCMLWQFFNTQGKGAGWSHACSFRNNWW